MNLPSRVRHVAASVALLTGTVTAQGTIIVPDHFPEIGQAVQAAVPGSTILVRFAARTYQPFLIDRSVTIVGLGSEGRTPTVLVGSGPGIDIRLGLGDFVHISRIDVFPSVGSGATIGVSIRGGRVALEDCEIAGGDRNGALGLAALDVLGATVDLVHARITGVGAAAGTLVRQSQLSAVGSRSFGGTGPVAGDGVIAIDSTVHASAFELFGGDAVGGTRGGRGLVASGATAVWLTDPLAAGGIGSPGGSGLVNNGSVPIEMLRENLIGGFDITTLGRAPTTVGNVVSNPNLLAAHLGRQLYRAGAFRIGLPFGMQLRGRPGLPVLLLVGGPAPQALSIPLVRQPVSLPTAPSFALAGVLDGTGYFTATGTVPNQPALIGINLWFQAVSGSSFPLEATPMFGAAVRG